MIEVSDFNTAWIFLNNVLQNMPQHAPTLLRMGKLYLSTGNLKAAQETLILANQLEPCTPEIQDALNTLQERQERRSQIPSIFLNGLGNSASEYLSCLLTQGLDLPRTSISTGVPAPENMLVLGAASHFSESSGLLAEEHLFPTVS